MNQKTFYVTPETQAQMDALLEKLTALGIDVKGAKNNVPSYSVLLRLLVQLKFDELVIGEES